MPTSHELRSERGATLAELMIALVILSIGILAVSQIFPAGSRTEIQARSTSAASYYVQEKIEELTGKTSFDAALTVGRHPAGTAFDTLGAHGTWLRCYTVSAMPAPLSTMKQVTVTVNWTFLGPRSVTSTTYLRR
jgi:prepilin-type N-terminal cleavage/methylation domain-containing protein